MTSKPARALLRRAAIGIFLSLLLVPLIRAADATKAFDIPADTAENSLKAFSGQSGSDVIFSAPDIGKIHTDAVKGVFTPADALHRLLAGSGLVAKEDQKTGAFMVGTDPNAPRVDPATSHPSQSAEAEAGATGSISGSIVRPAGGASIKGLIVTVLETGQSTATDGFGRFSISGITPGIYTLVITGAGYSRLKIRDAAVSSHTDNTLAAVQMPTTGSTGEAAVEATRESDLLELEKYEVMDRKPFTDENVDIVRTMNDVQPYYLFNSREIERSGALNVEDFLKNNLTMNTEAGTIAQSRSVYGASSSINFNGLGTNQTLILVDGRRVPAEILAGTPHQPPLNGIPLAAIDHIEVLPSSASAIYGGGAMAGVINVILKKNFSGGELSATYDNTFVSNTATRTIDLTDGISMHDGRIHLLITAHYSDNTPLTFSDRPYIDNYFYHVEAGNPALARYTLYSFATPNITSSSGNLVLKNGTALNSTETYISPGTAPGANLNAQLLANAGGYNTNIPGYGGGLGLYSDVEQASRDKMFRASASWDITPWLQAFAELSTASYATNFPESGPTEGPVPATAPTNPFQQALTVTFPTAQLGNLNVNNVIDIASVGLKGSFSADWQAEFDYTWSSDNLFSFNNATVDATALNAALASGAINPFVDTLANPIPIASYREIVTEGFPATLNDLGLRVSGNVVHIPAGNVQLITGLEHRKEGVANGYLAAYRPLEIPLSTLADYFGSSQSNNSAYLEAIVPVLKTDGPLRSLEAQLAGRYDAYRIGSGTSSASITPDATPPVVTYSPATATPFHTTIAYNSTNPTVGLKAELAGGLTLRTSYSTAFLPPTIAQLTPNPIPSTSLTTVTDPTTGKTYGVQTITGGNPSLTPQKAKDWDAGAIYAPHSTLLTGLRLGLEYYHIEEDNVISTLTAQQIVSLQANYPSRITRDPASGLITQVNISQLNLYKLITEGWDANISWNKELPFGTVEITAMGTAITHYAQQLSPGAPLLEYAGYANDGGPAKLKANIGVSWQRGPWTLGWEVTYFGSYKQSGAPGSPIYGDNPQAALTTTYLLAQGTDSIPSQTYNDVFAAYRFPRANGQGSAISRYLLDSWKIEAGVKDVFNSAPPLDAFNYSGSAPYSFYGDPRLRNYWIRIIRDF